MVVYRGFHFLSSMLRSMPTSRWTPSRSMNEIPAISLTPAIHLSMILRWNMPAVILVRAARTSWSGPWGNGGMETTMTPLKLWRRLETAARNSSSLSRARSSAASCAQKLLKIRAKHVLDTPHENNGRGSTAREHRLPVQADLEYLIIGRDGNKRYGSIIVDEFDAQIRNQRVRGECRGDREVFSAGFLGSNLLS